MKSYKQFTEELKQTGRALGSNPGGVHTDSDTGEQHYVKHYNNPDQGRAEVLASKIYNHMGIKTLNPTIQKVGDNPHAVVSKWNPSITNVLPHHFDNLNSEQQNTVGKMYHAAILTKNWDIIGGRHTGNVSQDEHGSLHAVDPGGAFHFRAQGAHKDYGPDIAEKDSLRNQQNHTSHVFNSTFEKNPNAEKHGLETVKSMDMNHIHTLFKQSGLPNHEELHKNFVERRNKLIS